MAHTLTVTPEMLDLLDQYLISDKSGRRILVSILEMAEQQIDTFVPGPAVTLTYTNHRGETAERTITPKRIWYGTTEWHPEPQWLVQAYDHEKKADRDFAFKDFGNTRKDGIYAAIGVVQKRLDEYVREHGSYDPETNVTEFPGDGEETVAEWEEIIEALEQLAGKKAKVELE